MTELTALPSKDEGTAVLGGSVKSLGVSTVAMRLLELQITRKILILNRTAHHREITTSLVQVLEVAGDHVLGLVQFPQPLGTHVISRGPVLGLDLEVFEQLIHLGSEKELAVIVALVEGLADASEVC